ncbi:MAG: type II secretion system protein [Bacilli bacterium]|nr:type II secretion system protein [Bacilli bacterium]
MKKINKKAFTMVELLAVIVILGILSIISVTAVQGIIAKAKERYYKSQEESMVMAAQSFLKNNQKQQPKVSGQTKTIKLETLLSNKYIDKVVDYKKETCSGAESYVKAFKYENEIYYTAYLKCPNYTTDMNALTSSINISTAFNTDTNVVNNSKATITITDSNGGDDRIQKGIVSYQYSMYKEGKLIYSSDVFNVKKTYEINKTVSLKEYVPGKIKITVTATNVHGLTKTKSFTKVYTDTEAPTCGAITGDSTTWKTGTRTVTVACSDGTGTGCTRENYTYEFKGDVKVGKIKIEDKAGNSTNCNVNVYIDNYPPVVTLKAYKKKAGEIAPTGSVMNQISNTKTSPNKSLTINGDTVNGWMNKAKWPNGVYLELDYSDISEVSKIEWKWNAIGLQKTNPNINTITQTSQILSPHNASGKSKEKIEYDGYRYGEIVITDQFNHQSTIKVTAPLDRALPNMPVSGDSTTWINTNRIINIGCTDAVSGCKTSPFSDTISSTLKTKDYSVEDNAGNKLTKTVNTYVDKTKPSCGAIENQSTNWTASDRNISVACSDSHSQCVQAKYSKNFNTSTKVGSIEIKDNAGNTQTCTVNAYVDKTPPKCNGNTGESTTWTNQNRNITINCKDDESGCKNNSIPKTFSSDMKTTNVTIEDKVGWTTNCPVNVYIDKSKPSCGATSGESTTWTKDNRRITVACTDGGESGCPAYDHTYNTSKEKDTITLKDGAGNSTTCNINVYVDKDKPTIGYSIYKVNSRGEWVGGYNSGEWSTKRIKRELYPNDTGGSGINHTEWSSDNVNWNYEGNVASWTYEGDGKNYTYFRTIDNAGNVSDSLYLKLKVDKTAPNTWARGYYANTSRCRWDLYEAMDLGYMSSNGSKKFWAGIITYATDDTSGVSGDMNLNYWYYSSAPAGCGRREYKDWAWTTGWSISFGCDPTDGHGGTVRYYACDNAGNCSGQKDHSVTWWGIQSSWYKNPGNCPD